MDLTDFIRQRTSELETQLSSLKSQKAEISHKIAVLEKEMQHLRNAAKAINMVNGLQISRRSPPKVTIKQAVKSVLEDFPDGLSALEILAEVNERFQLEVVRTSLSPQLTRLKRDGVIKRDHHRWRLSGAYQKSSEDVPSEPTKGE